MKRSVPHLSLKSYTHGTQVEKDEFIKNIFTGLKEYGFIVLKDHSLEQKLIDLAYQQTSEFFELEQTTKDRFGKSTGGQKGYTSFGKEKAKDATIPDLKEFWHTRRPNKSDQSESTSWPMLELPNYKESLEAIYIKMEEISYILLESIGKSLDVSDDFFKEMITGGNSILRSIHYPKTDKLDTQNALRAAPHEDINLITLLIGATSSGLELLDKDNTWLKVVSKPGEIIVDTGDMMSRLTNLVLPSTTHRVVNPDSSTSARYSMPFFVHPHSSASLKCLDSCIGEGPKFEEISAGDFLNERLREIGLL